jgi:hypothetical protein
VCKFFLAIFIGLLSLAPPNFAQARKEAGVFVGTSYYLGEINPTKQFYAPSPSIGLLFKFYKNDRHGFRFHAFYGQFQGNDLDFKNELQQHRAASFLASLLDMSAIYEFNFLPFKYNMRKTTFSPFLFIGVGYELMLRTSNKIGNHISIPFGTGIKYFLTKDVTIGTEWSFRKNFQDNMDGLVNPGSPKDKSIISHNDWYSFAGFFITFRLFDHSGDCPVYKQLRKNDL